jgi:hypothetical protein
MAFVPDSRQAGYLGPQDDPQQLVDEAWEDFLHDVIAGCTGLDPTLVRPRWQPEPANIPTFGTDWVAFGVSSTEVDFNPAVIHVDDGDGYDILQEHEVDTVLCAFYGPHAGRYTSYLRRGLFVHQNRAALRANAVGLVEVSAPQRAPELIKNQWLNRIDTEIRLRREIRFHYAVRNIVSAQGPITAEDFGGNIHHADFDTDRLPHPEEY